MVEWIERVDWTAVGTLTLAGVTFLYLVETRRLRKLAAKQASTTHAALSVGVRPIVQVDEKDIGWNDNRDAFWWTVRLLNYGSGPAMNGRVWWVTKREDLTYRRTEFTKGMFPLGPVSRTAGLAGDLVSFEVKPRPDEAEELVAYAVEARNDRPPNRWGWDIEFDDVLGDRWVVEYRPFEEVSWITKALTPESAPERPWWRPWVD